MNSFSAMNKAIDYEINRQILLHQQGQADQIVQETRLWDEATQVHLSLSHSLTHSLAANWVLVGENLFDLLLNNEHLIYS
jgi:hypothetical protein